MQLNIKIKMNNAAFTPDPSAEAARILRKFADKMEKGQGNFGIACAVDYNGNKCGYLKVTDDNGFEL